MRLTNHHSRFTSLALSITLALLPTALLADPLPTTNQNPFLTSAGIPSPLPMQLVPGRTQLSATLNWGSTAIVDSDADEILIVDGETRELRLTATHAYESGLAVRLELPYLHTGPGSLDSFIDNFHDTFGFSEGDRPLFERDQLTLWYLHSGQPSLVNRTRSTSGIGDLTISLGRQLVAAEHTAFAAWLSLSAPTAASGAYIADGNDWKLSATLSAQHRLGTRWSVYGQANVTGHTGEGVLGEQKNLIWSGIGGLQFAATPRVAFDVQVQANTAPIKGTDLEFLRGATILTVGGTIQATDQLSIHLGLSEDVQVEASPDAVFVMGVSTSW